MENASIRLFFCDDKDSCTQDTCDPKVGCVYTPLNASTACYDGNQCTLDLCDKITGCFHEPVVCENTYNDSCIEVTCDSIKGCVAAPIQCNNNDTCYVSYCSNGKCINEQLESCRLSSLIGIAAAATIGIGTIVGIIIAAVVCAGAAAGGAVAGYKFVHKGEFTSKNPLYEAETVKHTNPLHNRHSVFVPPTNADAQATDIQMNTDAQATDDQAGGNV
jgi:hypothetical protein